MEKNNLSEENILQVPTGVGCNNNCLFCMERTGSENKVFEPISLTELKSLFEKSRDVNKISFSFGEPTLNPNILDYIKLAKKTGFKEISMITNGRMLAYKKFARKLLEAGLTDITISIHGSNSNIHDLLTRVSGSFNQTIQGIRNISSFKKELDFNLAINITLTKPNLPYFEDILDLLIPFKADCINFNLVEPRGNALKHFGSIVPEYSYAAKKVCNALKHFYLNKKSNTDTRISISGIPFCLIDEEFRKNISKHRNYIYNIANALKKKLDFRKETMINSHLERKTKAVYCKQCKYFCCCEGIWKEYAKKRGFEEFKPILE